MPFPLHPVVKMSQLAPRVDPFVRVFIVADSLFYSALNFVTPLFAVFVTLKVSGGNIQTAAYVLTISFMARILTELALSTRTSRLSETRKIMCVIAGLLIITSAYFAFTIARDIRQLYLLWALIGFGQGLAFPVKLSLFSRHLDPNKEAAEWGVSDALNMGLIAGATALGGFVANHYGFNPLFLLASAVSLIGTLPYYWYYQHLGRQTRRQLRRERPAPAAARL